MKLAIVHRVGFVQTIGASYWSFQIDLTIEDRLILAHAAIKVCEEMDAKYPLG